MVRGKEEEVGLVSKATLVVSKVDSGQEVATQGPQNGAAGSSRGGAEVSRGVVAGGFNETSIFSEKCTYMVTSWLKPEIYV